MGLLTWVVGILAICASALVAREKAAEVSIAVSIAVLVGLVVFHPRNTLVGWSPHKGESSDSSHTSVASGSKLEAHKVNDSLYELYKPAGDPTMQVLFFHGLQLGDLSSEAHLSTWESGDGSCIWPKAWLAEEFPAAHILVVAYGEGLREGSAESFDMRIISENLTNDLIGVNIGQKTHCPVILVGHSFGGLVIKKLCVEAHRSLSSLNDQAKFKNFLENVKGICYYSTPHYGSPHIGKARNMLKGHLFKYFTTLSKDARRLNYDFDRLHKLYPKWQIEGLGEMLPVKMGPLRGFVVVPEESARDGNNFNLEIAADHFSICRPESKTSRRFTMVTKLLHNIGDDLEETILAGKQLDRNRRQLPKQMINMNVCLDDVKARLERVTTLGFAGMGGVGKTTLAMAVFNELNPTFEYSCFVPDMKLMKGTVDELKEKVWNHVHFRGKKVESKEDWSQLQGKRIFFVLDDISDAREITFLSDIVDNSSPQSRFIATSRDRDLLNSLVDIYDVPFLNEDDSTELFMSHAFPNQEIPSPKVENVMRAIVSKCDGLPLTLVVLGRYLKNKKDVEDWKQTLTALDKGETVKTINEKLWEKLRPGYDGLEEKEQQIFLDATTFFAFKWTLREAKAAWRSAYETTCERLLWRTLVDRCLVYEVEEDEMIRVHEQLVGLGRKIAMEPSNNGKCRVWEKTTALKLLQTNNEPENKDIHSLQFSSQRDDGCREGIHISSHSLHKLKKLQYLEADGPLIIDEAEEDKSFPSRLVVLRCVGLETWYLPIQDRLVVLHLSNVGFIPSSIAQLSALRIFIVTGLGNPLPDEIGDLSKLEYLEFRNCGVLESLPETFSKLSQLEFLNFISCRCLQRLPDTFGGLSYLKVLKLKACPMLRGLPQSFEHLFRLEQLELEHCFSLRALPDSFGNLPALNHLEISSCHSLFTLPESFGNLSALEHFKLHGCGRFEAFPTSFGKLSALRHLELINCGDLLPVDTFDLFTELQYLQINGFHRLIQIEKLPDSLGVLIGLRHVILDFLSIRSIPDYIKRMPSLDTLELGILPYVKEIPPWLGETGAAPLALSKKTFRVKDGCFSLTREEHAFASVNAAEFLISNLHKHAMEKMSESDYEGALADLCPTNLGEIGPKLRRFLLQERGIVRRFKGDLQGALEDLSAALGVFSEADDGREYMYDCWKHRGYVNFLLGDLDGAQSDGAMALNSYLSTTTVKL